MLVGSLIGDAMGGPLEFASDDIRRPYAINARQWADERRLTTADAESMRRDWTLMSYQTVRPDAAPYGPWLNNSPAGTLTDDSRHKIILIRAMRSATGAVTALNIATEMIRFQPKIDELPNALTRSMIDEGFAEYRFAAHWLIGERDPSLARPLERLWAGVDNCSGQMMMTPLAACFAGKPVEAYHACFELDCFDAPIARDITSAIVAGLAAVLGNDADALPVDARWRLLEETMRDVDPFRIADVPFVGRPLHQWMSLAQSIVDRADGSPRVAYRLLETDGKPVYYWDAHFTWLVAIVLLKIADYDPAVAMALAIDFGHDTDSYAQLIGAMIGAVCGRDVFPESLRTTVESELAIQYGERTDEWLDVLDRQAEYFVHRQRK